MKPIVNIAAYYFSPITDGPVLMEQIRAWAADNALLGTVLIADEGVNMFLAGSADNIEHYLSSVRADPRFADLKVKYSYSDHQPFTKLKVKVKPEIISFRQDDVSPVSRERAAAVKPHDLARWLTQGHDDEGKRVVMLDTRNLTEVEYGTFKDAVVLPINKFTELPDAMQPYRDSLKDATVVSFCTGGIRCEKAAIWMNDIGMDNVLQLEGGILGYFEAVGDVGYEGRCFVFDERIALDAQLQPLQDNDLTELNSQQKTA